MMGIVILILLPALVTSSGEGNIRLMQEEVTAALKTCAMLKNGNSTSGRHRRSEDYGYNDLFSRAPRIDNNSKQDYSQYNHERRNSSDMKDRMHVLNATDYDYGGYGEGNAGEKYVNTIPRPAINRNSNLTDTNLIYNRTKRNEPLFNKDDSDQCLSQCVFTNLQVVDSRGIPREAELWNKVQDSVTSQQSRAALRDQIRACFQELQSDEEDNECSYSNKLERCLMLRFADRKQNEAKTHQ